MPVRHPPLDLEGRLNIVLPGLAPLDLALLDAERRVDRLRLLRRHEDRAAVADEGFRDAVLADRGVEDHQIGGEILLREDATRQDRAAVVLENRDAIDL